MKKKKKNILLKKISLLNYLKKKIKLITLKSILHNYNINIKKKNIFLLFQKKQTQVCIVTGQFKNWQKKIYFSRFRIHEVLKKNELQNIKLK